MFLDTIAFILTALATISTAVWFIYRTATETSMGILGKLFFGIIMFPIITGIVCFVSIIITFGLATAINKLLGIEYDYTPSVSIKEENQRNPVDKATIARCQVLLELVDIVKEIKDSPIAYDSSISIHAYDVKLNQYGDYDEAVEACERLENDLLCYKTTLATTTRGYLWLRSMGEI